jgi:hypothetical protein
MEKEKGTVSVQELVENLLIGYRYLLHRWKSIIAVVIIGACLGYAYASMKKPVYTATTTFVLEGGESSSALGRYSGLASMVGIDVAGAGGGIFQGDNIIELYKSRTMISKTLLTPVEVEGKKQLLINYYIQANNLRESWKDSPQLKDLEFTAGDQNLNTGKSRLKDSLINTFVQSINKNNLLVDKLDKKLSIIKVDVRSGDEVFSKAFNDLIVKNVNDFYVQTKTKKALETVHILTVKVDSVRSVLNGAIYTSAAISDATPNLNPTRQSQRSVPIERSQITAETNKAMLGELLKNLELSKMSLLQEAPLIQIVDQPNFPLEKTAMNKIMALVVGAVLAGILICFFYLLQLLARSLRSSATRD